MERLPRRGTAENIRAQVWNRWAEGLNMASIARDFDVRPPRVVSIIHGHGGIGPAQRRRSARVLRATEREAISRGLVAGCSMREIARHLQRAPSSISREIARCGGVKRYCAVN
jgi:DNA-binding CsgD family transcriptional regulator